VATLIIKITVGGVITSSSFHELMSLRGSQSGMFIWLWLSCQLSIVCVCVSQDSFDS